MGIKNKIFDKFSEEVCSQIKCTEIHSDIKDEINSHLEEIKEEYMAEGAAEEDAERQAISHMGDSEKIGFDLNKIHKKSPEYKTLIIGLIFVLLGLFVQITIKISSPPNIIYYNYIKAIIHIILGIAVGIVIYIFDYRKLEKYSVSLFIIANAFAAFSLIMARPVNGRLYLNIMGSGYDVGLIELVLYIIALCGVLPQMHEVSYKYIKIISMYVLCSFFILKSGNLNYLITFYFITVFLLIFIRFSRKLIGIFLAMPVLSICYFFIVKPYRITKFIYFSESDINYTIYQLLSSSKPLGNGISKEIFLKLPFLNSDFIYGYIIYTFGWIAGAIIFALVILLLINLFKTSKLIKSNYGKMLFLSISFLFSIEFLVPMLMNINLVALPIGVSMPFFSYSGTSTIINSALVGVICSIYGRKNLSKSLVRIKDKI